MSTLAVDSITNATGTSAAAIDAGGRITTPARPAFLAGRTGGNAAFTLGTLPLNVTRINIGNCWNTTTYKFTAPVAGIYYFFGQGYYNDGAGNKRLKIRKNNNVDLVTAGANATANDESMTISIIEQLSVGDTIDLYSDSNSSQTLYYNINNTTHGAHTYFMGYLIG